MEIDEAAEAARERWDGTPVFEAIWSRIKGWDIERSHEQGYSGATGTDVGTICLALEKAGFAAALAASEQEPTEAQERSAAQAIETVIHRRYGSLNQPREDELFDDAARAALVAALSSSVQPEGEGEAA